MEAAVGAVCLTCVQRCRGLRELSEEIWVGGGEPGPTVTLVGGDGEVEGDGLGELDAGGGAGGDLILVGAGWGDADVGVASAAAAGGPEGGQGEEEGPEDGAGSLVGFVFAEGVPEEEERGGEEAEEGFVAVGVGVCVVRLCWRG